MELMSPNMDLCIIRYAEIALKGKNRQLFEKKLVDNLKNCLNLNKLSFTEIKRFEGRIFVYLDKKDDSEQKEDFSEPKVDFIEQATDFGLSKYNLLANVFGVSSISFPVESTLEPENIKEKIKQLINQYIQDNPFNTFRITTKKLDQTIAKSSHEFDVELGSFVETAYKKKVSLKEFDLNIQVELIHNKAYVFLDKIKGVGGLPYGIEGRTFALIENKQDLLACLLMMKRGCAAVCLTHLNLDNLESTLKTTFLNYGINPKIIGTDINLSMLSSVPIFVDFNKKDIKIKVHPHINANKLNKKNSAFDKTNISELEKTEKIKEKTEKIKKIENLTRFHQIKEFDKKTIEDLAKFHHIESIVTGQTLDHFRQLTNLVEFRPLIGMNEDEIECKIKEMIRTE